MKTASDSARFNREDYRIIRQTLADLPATERAAVVLRFWENYSIMEIAEALSVCWDDADRFIENALRILRDRCRNHPEISRAFSTLRAA